jgi:murein DD-endopeptidase MepM/ murein hydrolase activator NlpD
MEIEMGTEKKIKKIKRIKPRKIILFAAAFAVICSALLIAEINPSVSGSASASLEADINALQRQIAQREADRRARAAEIRSAENQIAAFRNEQSDALRTKRIYDDLVMLLDSAIRDAEDQISDIQALMALTELEIETAQDDYDTSYDLFIEMIKLTYEKSSVNYISMLLDSESFTDFLLNIDIISNMFSYTKNVINRLRRDSVNLNEMKENYEDMMRQQEEYMSELADNKADAEKWSAESQKLIEERERDINEWNRIRQELSRADADMLNEIRELQSQQSDLQRQRVYIGGEMIWPVDLATSRPVSSGFGPRANPFNRSQTQQHNGIDIPANRGVNIYAVNGGTVIISGFCGRGYGNRVVIDHGGGLTSLYAHNTRNLVSVGDSVNRGDAIATVGSTGYSTGNHLHFGLALNGVWVNPLQQGYLTSPWNTGIR